VADTGRKNAQQGKSGVPTGLLAQPVVTRLQVTRYPSSCALLSPASVRVVADPRSSKTQDASSTRPQCSNRTSYHSAQYQPTGTSTTHGSSSPISSSTSLPASNSLTPLNVAQHAINAGKPKNPTVAHNRAAEDVDALKATLRELGVELPDHLVARIARRYTGATAIERLLAEESYWVPGCGAKE